VDALGFIGQYDSVNMLRSNRLRSNRLRSNRLRSNRLRRYRLRSNSRLFVLAERCKSYEVDAVVGVPTETNSVNAAA
jgi:hypothetical protein